MRVKYQDYRKVCVITSSFPRFDGDYAGVFISELIGRLKQYGYSFRVVAPRGNLKKASMKSSFDNRISITRFNYFFNSSWEKLCYGDGMLNNFQRSLLAKIQLPFYLGMSLIHSIVSLKNCRIIWSHWAFPSGLIGALLRKITGKRHILSLHSGWSFLIRYGTFGKQIIRFIINNSDRISAVSHAIKAETVMIFPRTERPSVEEKIFLLPMGVLRKNFFALRKVPKAHLKKKYRITSKKVVLYIGRLIPMKGINFLIQAVKGISGLTLLIAGSGSEENVLRDMARGVKCRVRFLGPVLGKRKLELFRLVDVLVVPSVGCVKGQTEGLPVVILEAMASGIPVVASNIGGIKEVIKNKYNGLLIEQYDTQGLQDKLNLLFENNLFYNKVSRNALRESSKYELAKLGKRFAELLI
jgi:glycosyltransferase involved in cell wall biosynthesis